ncbi:hypothetical protein EJB05_46473, partial [Eragrostis curvula]
MQATNAGVTAASSPGATSTDAADGAGSSMLIISDAADGPVAELPLHLTEKILYCISPLESGRLATVCKSWAATVSARLAMPIPALYVSTPPDITTDRRGLVVSVTLDGSSPSATRTPSRVQWSDTNVLDSIGATPSGHVAFATGLWNDNVTLVNPVTGAVETIDVGSPALNQHQSHVLAAGPGDSCDSLFGVDDRTLFLWRRQACGGEKEAWSRCAVLAMMGHNHIATAVECNGCFYLLHVNGCLSRIDTAEPPPLKMRMIPVASLMHQMAYLSMKDEGRMLVCDGEVLFVRQRPVSACDYRASFTVDGFEVFRLDVKEQRWAKVDQLPADRAIFVSPGSSFAVRASEVEGCMSNCIYFVGKKPYYSYYWGGDTGGESLWGVYSMKDRRVLFENAVTEPGRNTNAVWFLPRVSLAKSASYHKFG